MHRTYIQSCSTPLRKRQLQKGVNEVLLDTLNFCIYFFIIIIFRTKTAGLIQELIRLDKSYQSINTCWKVESTKAKVLTIKHFSEETCREKLFPCYL